MTEWTDVAVALVGVIGVAVAGHYKLKTMQKEMTDAVKVIVEKTDTVIGKTDVVIGQNANQGQAMGRLEIRIDGRVEQLIKKVEDLSAANEKIALQLGIKQGREEERLRYETHQREKVNQEVTDRQRGSV